MDIRQRISFVCTGALLSAALFIAPVAAEERYILKVDSIQGDRIVCTLGELTQTSPGGVPPQPPEGEWPGKDGAGGTPPEIPAGERPNETGPQGPENGQPGGWSEFVSSDETLTFTMTDDTAVTVELLQGSQQADAASIAENAVLEVTLRDDGSAATVVVRNLQAGGGFGGKEVTNGSASTTLDADAVVDGETYTSTGSDENALRIDGAQVSLTGVTIEKRAGESSNTEDGDFYGANAGLLALNGAAVHITGAQVYSDAVNGNGVFSYGEGTTVNIADSVIRTSQRNSGGIQTTGGATMNASNLDVETQGASSAAIRSDRGGGDVNVSGGTYVTYGAGSPAIYSTADIEVADAVLIANASEAVVVEGNNSVSLENCSVTGSMLGTYDDSGENIHNIMIYQSMSGDAAIGLATFSASGGSITSLSGDMFYVTNTACTIDLSGVELALANETLLRVAGNASPRGWGQQGANGGDVTLNTDAQALAGVITVDAISALRASLTNGSQFTGAVNPEGLAGDVRLTLDDTSTWMLTADSYLSGFEGDTSQVTAGEYHLYVGGAQVL